jgi:hypothetical protein
MEIKKSCENCRNHWDCFHNPQYKTIIECVDGSQHQLDYQTLEAELQQMKAAVPDYDVLEQTSQEGLVNIVVGVGNQLQKAEAELQRYKEALKSACGLIVETGTTIQSMFNKQFNPSVEELMFFFLFRAQSKEGNHENPPSNP